MNAVLKLAIDVFYDFIAAGVVLSQVVMFWLMWQKVKRDSRPLERPQTKTNRARR
jgi:hypothetical protein